jgi:hypothetical protein
VDSDRHPNPASGDLNAAPGLGHTYAASDLVAHAEVDPHAELDAHAPSDIDASAHSHQDPYSNVQAHVDADDRGLSDALCVPGYARSVRYDPGARAAL